MIYSFDLSNFEGGVFVATRFPDSGGVGGDWVCRAKSDRDALAMVKRAAYDQWAAPETRQWDDYTVDFRDSVALLRQDEAQG